MERDVPPRVLHRTFLAGVAALLWLMPGAAGTAGNEPVPVEGQPLAANVRRLLETLEQLGNPLPRATTTALATAVRAQDARRLQTTLDPHVLFVVTLNPESRVNVARGPAPALLQQGGYTPVLVKVINQSTVTKRLRIVSRQAGPVYAGAARLSLERQQQTWLRENENVRGDPDRFLDAELWTAPPMTENLSGLEVEYALALLYSSEAGKREASIGFAVGQGNQDLGFRGETPILFHIRPAIPVKLTLRDEHDQPTVAKLLIRDAQGRVYPPQAKRLAPDFFFQPQIYRRDGDLLWLPPGDLSIQYSRGPEYRELSRRITVTAQGPMQLALKLERWIEPAKHGFYSGDHHIHAAGCAHYTAPTQGVAPVEMFLQVKGEGLNVGCVLTWGPCFAYQRQFFAPSADPVSEPLTVLKYDLEISGFGSQALGHVCLLNLRDQTYPGSDGTETKGWPTWTTPVLRWAKRQGAVTGYAHSASGLHVEPKAAARRLLRALDTSKDGRLSRDEAANGLLPEPFQTMDADGDGFLSETEIVQSHDRVADELPNLAVPEMNGVGAMETCVSTAEGVCDFISAMDTARIQEWNTWYHILDCGFPLKVSGETDFPCMSSQRVGQGRVYVQLGKVTRVDFGAWCDGLARGRSYVSDGYAHAVEFAVNGVAPGFGSVLLAQPGRVSIQAKVAFAPATPLAVAQGILAPPEGRRAIGDTVVLHGERPHSNATGGERLVEVVVNSQPAGSARVLADGKAHDLVFTVNLERSSWVALRQFPQLHTNPVNVLIANQPIRASRASARWCIETIKLLWQNRARTIAAGERAEAEQTFRRAIAAYEKIAREAKGPE